ncbi:MAG: outer membrane protein assembly factor BamA [Bacteroidota bacterium]
MRNFVFLLLGIFITIQSQAQFNAKDPKKYIVADIQVEGAEYSDKNAIIAVSGVAVGDVVQIPGQEISDIIKRLWKENIFSDVRVRYSNINEQTISLVIEVTERPRIAQFSFEGISKSQADDLREKINFIRGTILTDSKQQSAKRIIRNFYVEKGFYNTSVTINSDPDKVLKNGVAVKIIVDRGNKVKIDQIIVNNNEALTDQKVIKKLKKIHVKNGLKFWQRSKYVPKTYREAKAGLLAEYNSLGFRDAELESDTLYSDGDKFVTLELNMYEGTKYYHRDINWSGNLKYNSEILSQVLGIEKGDIYDLEKLNQRLTGDPNSGDVSSLYVDNGYLFFNVQPVEVRVAGDSIDLELRMQEGPQATVRRVIVEGNTKTADNVILRELRTAPGQKFSRADIIRSQREILALNYFDQENLGIAPIPNQSTGTVDIKYSVTEKPSDQLQLQGGWGGRVRDINGNVIAGGFVGTVQLAFNNFAAKRIFDPGAWRPVPSGDGQRLSLSFQMNGVGFRNISASFLEPWLGGKKPNSLGVNVSQLVFQNGGFFTNSERFRNSIFNTSVDFGRRLKFPDDFFRSFTSIGYKYYDIQNPSGFFPGFVGEDNAFINIITLKQSFERSSVDAPIYPRSGSILSFSVEATPPYSLFNRDRVNSFTTDAERFKFLEYHKWRFNSNWFWNIVGNMVVSAKVEAGYLGRYNRDLAISPFERFTLGGAGLLANNFGALSGLELVALRGYPDQSLNNNGDNFPIYNRMILELRQPLTLNQSAPVWVAAFAEAGNGYATFRDYNPFDVKRSLGVGVRVMLPMVGLLGLDWAYGYDRNPQNAPGDNTPSGSQFHFIIGQQF